MNTHKQINIMILLVFVAVFATGAYILWDPDRADSAKDQQLKAQVERGAYLFTQNCRVCHGNAGQGGAASNRLRSAPALNRPDLQGKNEQGEVVKSELEQDYKFVFNTITCGRVGKAMPTWGEEQGGTLNEEQIKQLALFITRGDEWELANEYAIRGIPSRGLHGDDADGLYLTEALSEDATTVSLNSVAVLGEGVRLQVAIDEEPADEIMLITDVNPDNNTVTVDRGVGTTDPAAYESGARVLKVPSPPQDPVPTVQAACGQIAGAAQPDRPLDPPSATLQITAQGIAWDKTRLSALPNVPLTLTMQNNDAGTPHNIHFTQGADPGGEDVAATDIENGVSTQTLNFGPLAPGDYYYLCDVHPNMEGVLTAAEAGAQPAAGGTPAAGSPTSSAIPPAGATTSP